MKVERRQKLTRRELEAITSRRPVVRRVPPEKKTKQKKEATSGRT